MRIVENPLRRCEAAILIPNPRMPSIQFNVEEVMPYMCVSVSVIKSCMSSNYYMVEKL